MLLVGCGAVGTVTATHLAGSDRVDELILADVDGVASTRALSAAKSDKARALRLDASSADDLRRAMKDVQIVVNAALPRFNRGIKEAALASGIDYMDLATESSDPFVDTAVWKDAGLTALVGMGEDPGLSDVFARLGADGMDEVESIRIRDGDTGHSPGLEFVSLFSPESFVEETTTPSRIWRNGAYEMVPPFGAHERFEFPAPLGPLDVYSVDHEEVDSLPRFIGKGVQYVDFKLALDAATVAKLREFQDFRHGATTPEEFRAGRRRFLEAIPKPADLAGKVLGDSGIFVEVRGRWQGRRKTHTFYTVMSHPAASRDRGATATAYLTGTGAAAGALLLAQGAVRKTGVIPPEELDPAAVLPLVRERGIEVEEHIGWGPSGA